MKLDEPEIFPTHILVLQLEDGKEERWGPMPQRRAELTKEALDEHARAPWYRSSRIVQV